MGSVWGLAAGFNFNGVPFAEFRFSALLKDHPSEKNGYRHISSFGRSDGSVYGIIRQLRSRNGATDKA